MRENDTKEFRTLAADEALEYAREAENLDEALQALYKYDPANRAAIGRANARLGVALKLAEVHAALSITEQIVGLRSDLAWVPETPARSAALVDLAGRRAAEVFE